MNYNLNWIIQYVELEIRLNYKLNFDSGEGAGHGFAANDLIRHQKWDNAHVTITVSDMQVTAIDGTGSLSASLT